jgi:hypothetical protein
MPPKEPVQDDELAGADSLAAHARGGAPSPDPDRDSPGSDDAALPAPAEPDVPASGAHHVADGGPNSGHPMITRGSLRNESRQAPAAPNFGDHGENGRVPGRSSISWNRRLFAFDFFSCAPTIPVSVLTRTCPRTSHGGKAPPPHVL